MSKRKFVARRLHLRRQRQLRGAWTEQEGYCFYCDRRAWLWEAEYPNSRHLDPQRQATREHLIRQIDGGSDEDENIVMACQECNSSRGDKSAEAWLEIKEREADKNFGDGQKALHIGTHLRYSNVRYSNVKYPKK